VPREGRRLHRGRNTRNSGRGRQCGDRYGRRGCDDLWRCRGLCLGLGLGMVWLYRDWWEHLIRLLLLRGLVLHYRRADRRRSVICGLVCGRCGGLYVAL